MNCFGASHANRFALLVTKLNVFRRLLGKRKPAGLKLRVWMVMDLGSPAAGTIKV